MGKITNEKGQPVKGLEVSKGMPNEVKNQVAPDGKPRVITEDIPEEHKKILDEKKKERQKFLNQFLQISFQITQAQMAQQKLVEKLDSFDQSLRSKVEWVMRKMKLHKQKNRAWRYDGRGAFIGIYNPPKPKKEKK